MSPAELKAALQDGRLDKAAYIERMFGQHAALFAYADFLPGSDVERITILHGEVRVAFAWPPVELVVPRNEMRAAPVEAINFGSYERREFAVVEGLVAALPAESPVFIDIGGNIGFYSIGLKRLHPRLRVHAFEPVPATADLFEANCRINNCSDISLHRCGLSDRPGEATFHVHPQLSVAASQQDILGLAGTTRVTLPLARLDDLAGELPGPVSFIKCDVEGAELFAFRGAAELIARDKPVVFSEMLRKWSAKFGYHPNDIIALFKRLGYQCHAITGSGSRAITEVTDATAETNFIFLHASAHEGLRLHS
jgi:FkbM family methyltransferase